MVSLTTPQYVGELLELIYQSDSDVAGDEELRAFTADVSY